MRETSQPVVNKVAIIGAGPGGLATAIALRKKGIDAHVYERAKEFCPAGAGLALRVNGLRCLDAIEPDIAKTLKNSGCQVKRTTFKTSTGEIIRTSQSTTMEKYGQPLLIIWWWRLQQILASALPPEVIHLNHSCIGFEQNQNTVIIHFNNGKTAQAELLVGADGVNSTVRQALIGDGEPQYLGSMSWRAIADYNDEVIPADEVILMKGEQSILFLLNLGEGNMNWVARKQFSDSSVSPTPAEAKSRVLKEYANWIEPVRKLMEATDAERILERPICHRLPLKQWSYGRVTLLGDAAHPMSPSAGQGANTTFEDAYELAECLGSFPDLETALGNYDKRRIQRTAIIQTRSARGEKTMFSKPTQQTNQQRQKDFQEFQNWVYDYDPKSESRLKPWQEKVVVS